MTSPCLRELSSRRNEAPAHVDQVVQQVEATVPTLSCEDDDWMTRETVKLAARMLAKLFPSLHLEMDARLSAAVKQQVHTAVPTCELVPAGTGPRIHIGGALEGAVCADSDGWTVRCGGTGKPFTPFDQPRKRHPATPLAAAALACTQLVAEMDLPLAFQRSNEALEFHMWGPDGQGPEVAEPVTLDAAFMGCGSIGGTAVATLLDGWSVAGKIEAVDHDSFEPRNEPRYPLLDPAELDTVKVGWLASKAIRHPALQFTSKAQDVRLYSAEREEPVDCAVISFDNVDARRWAADMMPRRAVSATLDGLTAAVTRCDPLRGVCPFCAYLPRTTRPEDDRHVQRIWAQWTGLSLMRVRQLTWLGGNAPAQRLAAGDLRLIEGTWNKAPNLLDEWVGRSFLDLVAAYEHDIYSAVPIVGQEETGVVLPLPFGSALAAAMTLAQVLRLAMQPDEDGWTWNEMRSSADSGKVSYNNRIKPPSGACLCQHPMRKAWMDL